MVLYGDVTRIEHRVDDTVRHALEAAGVACWDLDLAGGLLRRSAGYDEIFGAAKPPAGWRQQEAFAAFLAEDRESVIEAFAQAPLRGSIEFEKRIQRASDGAIRWVHMKGRAYARDGKTAGIAGVARDVTRGHLSAGKLRQSQQMEAAGQLAREVAHGLNNLLMVIGGNLEMLSERIPVNEKTDRLLAALNHGVERGATLTRSLKAFARPQDLRIKEICVDELILSSRDLLGRAAGEAVSIEMAVAQPALSCGADPRLLMAAILNLVDNAREAMPQGGSLTLSTGLRELDEEAAASAGARPGDYVAIAVADTGAGIAPDLIERVFEPFFTTKTDKKGAGCGLSQVYALASQSGGFVTVESPPNSGTTVAICLPRVPSI